MRNKIDSVMEMEPPAPQARQAVQKPLQRLSFFHHLDELRSRVLKALAVYVICVLAIFQRMDVLLDLVMKPVGRVIFTSPEEAFCAQVNLALLAGFVLALPFTLYQIWQFVSLGLKEREKKYIKIFGPFSFICFATGVMFAYFVMIPMSLKFLLNFSSEFFVPMITVDHYISFIGTWILACGIVFELPLVLAFLAKIGIATPEFLRQQRRYAIVAILIVSAIITPPDVMSQLLMSAPLILLYEIGIWVTQLTYRASFPL